MTAELAHVTPGAGEIDKPDVTAEMVTAALVESRSWLAVAMQGTDPTPIAEFKAWAATVEEATKQKRLGREIELDAAEMVRRAERGIGVAIRNGQEAGEIRRHGQGGGPFPQRSDKTLYSPTDFAPDHELRSNGAGIYHMTDDVSDEQFEEAVVEAKSEGNLSRANVVRKVKGKASDLTTRKQRADRIADLAEQGYSTRQMATTVGIGEKAIKEIARDFDIDVPGDKAIGKTRRHDSNRIAQETVNALSGLAMAVDLIDFADLHVGEAAHWATSLADSFRALNRFHKQIKEITQ